MNEDIVSTSKGRSIKETATKALAYTFGALIAAAALSVVVKKVSDSDNTDQE